MSPANIMVETPSPLKPSVLIAFDGSGSTGSQDFYHDETQRIVASYKQGKAAPLPQILFWDSSSRIISHEELKAINDNREGGGGTDPAAIASYIKQENFVGDLVIITDGEVGSVDHVSQILPPHWTFNKVTAFLIPTGWHVNMSVTCPFTRHSPHQVYLYDEDRERRLVTSVTTEEMQHVQKIGTISSVAEYEAVADALEKHVVALTMGTQGDPLLRDSLLAMKKRIMRADAMMKGESATVRLLDEALNNKEMDTALLYGKTLTNEYYISDDDDPDSKTWSARISRLVSMAEGALHSAFDLRGLSAAIRGDRARRAGMVAPAPIDSVPLTTEEAEAPVAINVLPSFECPITMDREQDVALLIAAGAPLLTGCDKDVSNSLFDCPLNLFNYPDLITQLESRLDHPISLRALKESYDAGAPIEDSPFTRRPLMAGALCLGTCEQHCEATAWTLAHIFTGGKAVGNMDLWFACVWLLVERISKKKPTHYLSGVLPQLREHMLWRLNNHQSSLSLMGLPEFPTTRVLLRTAVWYVFASAQGEMATDPRREVFRAHLPHLTAFKELYVLSGLQLSEAVENHERRLRTLLSFLAWIKRDNHELPNLVMALTQNCLDMHSIGKSCAEGSATDSRPFRVKFERRPRFVPIDGPSSESQIALVRSLMPTTSQNLSVSELIGLADLVAASKSAGDIPLPCSWKAPQEIPNAPKISWPEYGLKVFPRAHVNICTTTCRPYIKPNGESWKNAASAFYNNAEPSKLLSVNELFINFVFKYRLFPTVEELIFFIYNKCVFRGAYESLPFATHEFALETLEEFAELSSTLSPEEFVRRAKASMDATSRALLEKEEE